MITEGRQRRWRAEEEYLVVKTASQYGFVLWTTHQSYKSRANRKLRPLLQAVLPHTPRIFQVKYREKLRRYLHQQELQSLGSTVVYLRISVKSMCVCRCQMVGNYTLDHIVDLLCVQRTAVAQWLRCCATNLKVAFSFLAGVIGNFH